MISCASVYGMYVYDMYGSEQREVGRILLREYCSKSRNSMKPYPSVFHAYASDMKPVIGFVGATTSR